MLVQFFPGDSLLHRLDPRTKVAAVLVAAITVLAAANWQGLGLAAVPILAAIALTRLPVRVFCVACAGSGFCWPSPFGPAIHNPGKCCWSWGR